MMSKQLDKSKMEMLTPQYEFGCKRLCFSSEYYPAFSKSHVFLHREPIISATGNTICLKNGEEHELDVKIIS